MSAQCVISKALPHINVLGTLKCSKPLALTTVRWALLKDMIDEGDTAILQDVKLMMVYTSLLQLPIPVLWAAKNIQIVTGSWVGVAAAKDGAVLEKFNGKQCSGGECGQDCGGCPAQSAGGDCHWSSAGNCSKRWATHEDHRPQECDGQCFAAHVASQDTKLPRGTTLASVGSGKPQEKADGKLKDKTETKVNHQNFAPKLALVAILKQPMAPDWRWLSDW